MTLTNAEQREKEKIKGKIKSMRRAQRSMRDLAACNEWSYYVTLGLDRKKIDCENYNAAMENLRRWLDNKVKRKGLKYIGIPERRKDKTIRFHFLVNDCGLKLDDSWRIRKGRKVYDIVGWNLGKGSAVTVDDKNLDDIINYFHDCIFKQFLANRTRSKSTVGGRYYYHGGELTVPKMGQ